jgi:hypothetical protein
MSEKYGKYFVGITKIRNAQIIGTFRHVIEPRGEDRDAIITQFLAREYADDDAGE